MMIAKALEIRIGWLIEPMSGDILDGRGYQVRGQVSHREKFFQNYLTREEAEALVDAYVSEGYSLERRDGIAILTPGQT